jgi:hypothetical protein
LSPTAKVEIADAKIGTFGQSNGIAEGRKKMAINVVEYLGHRGYFLIC